MTHTQEMKAHRKTAAYKAWKKDITSKMKSLKNNGQEYAHLASCPESYSIYLKMKHK